MQATAEAMPMPVSDSSLGNRWLTANLLAALTIPLTAGVLPVLASRAFPGLSVTAFSWVSAVVGFVAVVVCLTVYATLTASVLREKLPAFSGLAWVAGHLAFAAVLGLILARAELESAPDSTWWWYTSGAQLDESSFLFTLLLTVPLLGALVGGLQALVLRTAARRALAWVAASAIGFGAIAALSGMVSSFDPIFFLMSEDITFVVRQSVAFAWVMVMAILMLPAFNRLTPKN